MLSMLADSCPVQLPESPVQRNVGPVNGGGNSDLLKVETTALVKSGYMLEHPSIPHYS